MPEGHTPKDLGLSAEEIAAVFRAEHDKATQLAAHLSQSAGLREAGISIDPNLADKSAARAVYDLIEGAIGDLPAGMSDKEVEALVLEQISAVQAQETNASLVETSITDVIRAKRKALWAEARDWAVETFTEEVPVSNQPKDPLLTRLSRRANTPTARAAAASAVILPVATSVVEATPVAAQTAQETTRTEAQEPETMPQATSLKGSVDLSAPTAVEEVAETTPGPTETEELAVETQGEAPAETVGTYTVVDSDDGGLREIVDRLRNAGVLPDGTKLVDGDTNIIHHPANSYLFTREAPDKVVYGPDYLLPEDPIAIPGMRNIAISHDDTAESIAARTGIEQSIIELCNPSLNDERIQSAVALIPGDNLAVDVQQPPADPEPEIIPAPEIIEDEHEEEQPQPETLPSADEREPESPEPTETDNDQPNVVMPSTDGAIDVEEIIEEQTPAEEEVPVVEEAEEQTNEMIGLSSAARVVKEENDQLKERFEKLGNLSREDLERIAGEIRRGERNLSNFRNFRIRAAAEAHGIEFDEAISAVIYKELADNGANKDQSLAVADALVPFVKGDFDGTIKNDGNGIDPSRMGEMLQFATANGMSLETPGEIIRAAIGGFPHQTLSGQELNKLAEWYQTLDKRITPELIKLANDEISEDGMIMAGAEYLIPWVDGPPTEIDYWEMFPLEEEIVQTPPEDDEQLPAIVIEEDPGATIEASSVEAFMKSIEGLSAQRLAEMVRDHANINIRDSGDQDELDKFIENGVTWTTECDEWGSDRIEGVTFTPNMLGFMLYAAENGISYTVIDFGAADAHSCTSFHTIGQGLDVAHSADFYRLADKTIREGNVFGFDELFHDNPPAGTSNWDRGKKHHAIGGHGTHDHAGFKRMDRWNNPIEAQEVEEKDDDEDREEQDNDHLEHERQETATSVEIKADLPEIRVVTLEQVRGGDWGTQLDKENFARALIAAAAEGDKSLWQNEEVLKTIVPTFYHESARGFVNARGDTHIGNNTESMAVCQMYSNPDEEWGRAEHRRPENNLDIWQHLDNCYKLYRDAGGGTIHSHMQPWSSFKNEAYLAFMAEFEEIIETLLEEYGLDW